MPADTISRNNKGRSTGETFLFQLPSQQWTLGPGVNFRRDNVTFTVEITDGNPVEVGDTIELCNYRTNKCIRLQHSFDRNYDDLFR